MSRSRIIRQAQRDRQRERERDLDVLDVEELIDRLEDAEPVSTEAAIRRNETLAVYRRHLERLQEIDR